MTPIGLVPECWPGITEDCVTIGYSIIGDPDPESQKQYQWIDDIMQRVSAKNNFIFQKDVRKLTVGTEDAFLNYLAVNPNATRYSVLWCTTQWEIPVIAQALPCTFSKTHGQS